METLQNGSPLALQLQLLYLDRPIKYMDVEEGKGIRRDGALSPRHSVRQRLLSNSNTEGSGTQGQKYILGYIEPCYNRPLRRAVLYLPTSLLYYFTLLSPRTLY